MSSKNKEVAKQIEWKYDEDGNAVAVIPEEYREEEVKDGDENFVTWDREGARVEGIYLKKEEVQIQDTDTFTYTFQIGPDPGTDVMKCHGTTQLDRMMSNLPHGDWTKIVYEGEVSTNTSGRTFKKFRVSRLTAPVAA